MIEFSEYLESNGIKGTNYFTDFINEFLQSPSMFFGLTVTERDEMEKRIDEALELFITKKPGLEFKESKDA